MAHCKPNENYLDLYSSVKRCSEKFHLNFQEAIEQANELLSKGHKKCAILARLEQCTARYKKLEQSDSLTSGSRVWLLIGQTGQGKSSLTNAICKQEVAQEGRGNHSLTSKVKLYQVPKSNLYIMDTPGFYDTRLEMNDEKTADEIVGKVQKNLKADAHIEAIILMWDPARCLRLQLDAMLDKVCTCFGPEALDSLVFVINKVDKFWSKECKDAVDELESDLESKELTIPVVILDPKKFKQKDFDLLEKVCQEVELYREADFEEYRKVYYYQKFCELKKAEDVKQRERKEIEDNIRKEERKRAEERERRLQQEREEEQRRVAERERRLQQENEEERRRIAEGERILRQEEEEQQRRVAERERRLQQENEEERRRTAERERRLQQENEEQRRRLQEYEEKQKLEVEILQQQQRMSCYGSYLPINFLDYSWPCSGSSTSYSNNCNINPNASGRRTASGALDCRDTSNRYNRTLTKDGRPDIRFNCNKK